MTTVEFTLTGSYQVIGTKIATWVAVQNIGNTDITINLKATTPPVDADKGIILKPMQIVTNIQIGDAVREGNPNKTNVEVNYSENTITLEFASLQYTNPLKNQYKY